MQPAHGVQVKLYIACEQYSSSELKQKQKQKQNFLENTKHSISNARVSALPATEVISECLEHSRTNSPISHQVCDFP